MNFDQALADARRRYAALDARMRSAITDGRPFARWRELHWARRVMQRLERQRVDVIRDARLT